jgi:predicted nucleic acid-binding protein
VALVDHRDKWHTTAKAIFSKLDNLEFVPIYFDCVMNESFSILGRRAEEQKRLQDVRSMFSDLTAFVPKPEITWVSKETERLYDDIVKLVEETQGKLNFHDALIALCCREGGLQFIFSFDKDFDDVKWLTRVAHESDIP